MPLIARMLAAAIVGDLLTVAAALQSNPVATLVAIDEFSAIAADGVARLFGRGRSAGFSLLLATQELADLGASSGGPSSAGSSAVLEQVLGNLACLIAHRQGVPASAELIASIGGTRGAWQTSQTVEGHAATPRGSRTRGREYLVHPDQIRVALDRHRRGDRRRQRPRRHRPDLPPLTGSPDEPTEKGTK